MEILVISTTEKSGGAAIAANRLVKALNKSGEVSARMLVRDKSTTDNNVTAIPQSPANRIRFIWERAVIWICNRFSRKGLFEVSIANTGYDITKLQEFKEADLIHIHWTQQGMLSIENMKKIFMSGKPVVWTMHDMWACTGICHHAEDCLGFQDNCRFCPKSKGKLAHYVFNQKMKLYKSPFEIITCSQWLQSKAETSTLLKEKSIHCIGNALDINIFRPYDKKDVRMKLSLPADKRLILFASQKVTDKRKGIDYLVEAANILKRHSREVEFIVMGNNADQIAEMLPYPVHSMGYVSSVAQSASVYQAADMFVTPSLMENLPNTIAESLACGIPCIGFRIGGIPEMIDHKINGYVANYQDAADFAAGIEWILDHPDYSSLSLAAVNQARICYSESVIAQQHLSLYKSLI